MALSIKLSGVQIAQLSAVILGSESYTRSKSTDAAAKRFISLSQVAKLPYAPLTVLEMQFEMALAVVRQAVHNQNAAKADIAAANAAAVTEPDAIASDVVKKAEARKSAPAAHTPTGSGSKSPKGPRVATKTGGTTKRELAAQLLLKPEGATTADILAVTGWTKVSVPAIAKSSKLALRQQKDGNVTRYWGEKIAA